MMMIMTRHADSTETLLCPEPPEFVGGSVSVVPDVPIVPHNVLKDGVLEKKGNTTITTWNRSHTHTHTHTPVSYTHLTLPTRR